MARLRGDRTSPEIRLCVIGVRVSQAQSVAAEGSRSVWLVVLSRLDEKKKAFRDHSGV